MNISMEELREVKHQLPTGSVSKIAQELGVEEQTVRNYFGARKYADGKPTDSHIQPGPHGGYVHLEDTSILEKAKEIITRTQQNTSQQQQAVS